MSFFSKANNLLNQINNYLNSDDNNIDKDVEYDKRSISDILHPYSTFNFNDVMNDIYIIDELRQSGDEVGAKRVHDSFINHNVAFTVGDKDISAFLQYLVELSDEESQNDDNNLIKNRKAVEKTSDKEKLVSAIIIRESKDKNVDNHIVDTRIIQYDTLTKFLDMSHGKPVDLSRDEFTQLSSYQGLQETSMYRSVTRNMVAKYPIPDVNLVKDIYQEGNLSDLYDEYAQDEYFKQNYKINNIYKIEPNDQSKNAHLQGKNKITLNSGTGNESLIKIMNGGFKRPSQLAREAGVRISGQMFGDAIYLARPNQISKNTSYVDRKNQGNKFIMVADVYYDKKEVVSRAGNYNYTGKNLIVARDIGAYSRDEYMTSPKQIDLKYILEISKGVLKKPEKKKDNKVDLDMTDINDTDATQAI